MGCRVVRWLHLRGLNFEADEDGAGATGGAEGEGAEGEEAGGANAAAIAMARAHAKELMAYAARCVARDRSSGENLRRAWAQYERYGAFTRKSPFNTR